VLAIRRRVRCDSVIGPAELLAGVDCIDEFQQASRSDTLEPLAQFMTGGGVHDVQPRGVRVLCERVVPDPQFAERFDITRDCNTERFRLAERLVRMVRQLADRHA
jgi:hypothetical protein